MKSLYETILSTTSSGKAAYFVAKNKEIEDEVFGALDGRPFQEFLKRNNLLLDKDHTYRIMLKMVKSSFVPYNAEFRKGRTLEDQLKKGPEDFFVMQKTGFAGYDIIVEFTIPDKKNGTLSSTCERILSFQRDSICVLAIPETEPLIKELDKYFEKSTKIGQISYGSRSSFNSRIGGRYLQYMFVDMKKEFVI